MPVRRVVALVCSSLLALSAVAVASGPASAGGHDSASSRGGIFWRITPTGSDDEFRGLAAVSARVAWVSGEAGTVLRTVDGGDRWRDVSPPQADGLALRDIEATGPREAITLSIGPGGQSRIYSTSDGGRTWTQRFRNPEADAFYDCFAFNHHGRGLALSDPVKNHFRLAASRDFGKTWRVLPSTGMPRAKTGEFAFAASGTCMIAGGRGNFWFVTGGIRAPRVFHSTDGGRSWTASKTPLRGGESAGIYSIDFRNLVKAIIVGGDYADETNGADAAAYLQPRTDGFVTSTTPVRGYRSGVAWVRGRPHTAVAVGPTGSDVSFDGGRTWNGFDGNRYDGVECTQGACWASGTDGRVAILQGF